MSQAGSTGSGGSGGSGIITIDGNTGSVTGSTVTITTGASHAQGTALFTGSGTTLTQTFSTATNNNTGIGQNSLLRLTSGLSNTAFGTQSLFILTSASNNTAVGYGAGEQIVGGSSNSLFGTSAGSSISSGINNCAFGLSVLGSLTTGQSNLALGNNSIIPGSTAGYNYASSESSNIVLMNAGVLGDNNVIRIGTQGSADGQQNACYIAGITGATVTGSAVLCDTTGLLGTIASSRIYKENIQDIGESSILALRPVKFNYIASKEKPTVYGLIAEEVEPIFPDLVLYRDGKVDSIKYHEMPALLLNEIQKLNARIAALEAK